MADFCKQCSEEIMGADYGNFRSINRLEHTQVLCEGCGHNCVVDFTGECLSPICMKKHGAQMAQHDDIAMQEQEIARWIENDSLGG